VGVKKSAGKLFPTQFESTLLKLKPQVELFKAQDKISDEVSRAELDAAEHEFMKGLFIKAGLWDARDVIFAQDVKTARQLSEASKRLTTALQSEWEQGRDLQWEFEHVKDGAAIRLHIEDPAVSSRWVKPSQRSSGFTAFFVLSLTTFARTSFQKARSFIYLFDEPGTYLHPIAQINLQRVFESLAGQHQLAYTTHSMFLVNKNNPKRNRVIRKGASGTSIDAKPFSGNWKAVRESLGILMAHNFLIAEHTLLVEGPSDPIYLLACLGKLVESGKVDVDLNDFSVVDGGDERNYVAMAKLMLNEGRRVVALLDGDGHGRKLKERLEKIAGAELSNGTLKIELLPPDCSIEDLLIVPELYVDAACDALKEVVSGGILAYADGYDDERALAELRDELGKKPAGKTLGKHTDEVTATLVKEREPISKLNIAMKYEDALASVTLEKLLPSPEFSALIKSLQTQLKLHPRKAGEGPLA
jgi:hypothetical protein